MVTFNPACLYAGYAAYDGALLLINGTSGPDLMPGLSRSVGNFIWLCKIRARLGRFETESHLSPTSPILLKNSPCIGAKLLIQ